MKQLSDYLLITDMDGTLLDPDGNLPPRNVEAIRRFTEAGGRFGIATGRSRGLMLDMAEGLPINAPCVMYNGGMTYDFATDRLLHEQFLPEAADGYVRQIMERFPTIGVMVIRGDSYYQIQVERAFAHSDTIRRGELFKTGSLEEMDGPWYKILFQLEKRLYPEFLTYVDGMRHPGVRFVSTNYTLVEMLPEDSSKAAALQRLMDTGVVRRENLVAIGDFYNDLEMIELAGLGVTLETSPADIREKADLIVGDCARGAVADLIEHLERNTGR